MEELTLEQQAKNIENMSHEVKFIEDQLMLSHTIGEQSFDLEVSNIEHSLTKDIKNKENLPLIIQINNNIKNRS